MLLSHLRTNVVGYLALVIALSTASYAAATLPNESVTTKKLASSAVTTTKIKKNAVTGKKIRRGTVTRSDLKRGLLPADSTILGVMEGATLPASPFADELFSQVVETPRTGTVYVRVFISLLGYNCNGGSPTAGLYVDDEPVAGTALRVTTVASARSFEIVGTTRLAAGSHELQVGVDCGAGTFSSSTTGGKPTWTVLVP